MYNLLERPVEPQASLPHCRQCHIELDPGYYDKVYKHRFEEHALENTYQLFKRRATYF